MLRNSNTSIKSMAEQLSLSFYEVRLESGLTTAEVRSRYGLKSIGQGQLSYERQTPLGTFEARRVGRLGGQGRPYLWDIFFRPKR